jgi:PPOX class probable FMN-dependent enzyme
MTDHRLTSEADLAALYPQPSALVIAKAIDHLDVHCRSFLALSPFMTLGTQSADGKGDVSPRGDKPGFALVLDDRALAIPDRPGNNRLDSLRNIVANPAVGLLFLIPGVEEMLRVNGNAHLSTDPALLARMAVDGKPPRCAIVVELGEAYLHCAKAVKRSRLWEQEAQVARSALPSLARMVIEQTKRPSEEAIALEERLKTTYATTLY